MISKFLKENSPVLLAGVGIGSFIAATVMAAYASRTTVEKLDELPEDARLVDKVKTLAPTYAPAAGMILLGTACIVASNKLYKERYLALMALYSVGERSLRRWQDAVESELTKKKATQVRNKVYQPVGDYPSDINLPDDYMWFYDDWSGRYFPLKDMESVRSLVNDLNEDLYANDWVTLNDFYFGVGLPPVDPGDRLGWAVGRGQIEITYGSTIHREEPCVTIVFTNPPREEY